MKENNNDNDTNVSSIENSIEEAIERLEYIDRTYSYNNYYSIWDLKCIEILLSDYKRVLKENEELKETYKSEKKMKNEYVKLYQDLLLKENVIPIQKVKDRIEKLKNNPLKIKQNDKYYYETDAYNKIVIQVLQELLEGRK